MRASIHALFGAPVTVCLDPFHWFQRWNDCINVPVGSILNILFRSQMRDAVLTPDEEDYRRAKERLPPDTKHSRILLETRRVILPPHKLRSAIDKVINTWMQRDLRLMQESAQRAINAHCGMDDADTSLRSKAPLFFKMNVLPDVRRRQMAHVCRQLQHQRERGANHCKADCTACLHICREECTGCLSDPPGVDVNFNRQRDADKRPEYYTGRGSSQLENLHHYLGDQVLSSVCGPFRCHNLMLASIYDWNIDRRCQNCDCDSSLPLPLQHRAASLLRINSYAASAQQRLGASVELPFQHVRAPTRSPDLEKLGCECHAYPDNLLSPDADDGLPTADPGNSGSDPTDDPNGGGSNVAQRRVLARGDGRCGLRSFLHAAGPEALVAAGLPVPLGMDLLQGNDEATWRFICQARRKAVSKLRAALNADAVLHATMAATFPDDSYATLEAWLAAMMEDDSTQAVSSLWDGGGTLLFYALAKLLGVQLVITNLHTTAEGGQQAFGPPVEVANFGPNVIHVAQVHDDAGVPFHFDLLVDDYSLGQQPSGTQEPTIGAAVQMELNSALRHRQSGLDFLQSITGLGALHPEPIYDKPTRDSAPDPSKDERELFDSMYRDYNRHDHGASSRRSYKAFQDGWTARCVEEANKRLRGEPFLQLRLKTKAHLADWYDHLQEALASADAM